MLDPQSRLILTSSLNRVIKHASFNGEYTTATFHAETSQARLDIDTKGNTTSIPIMDRYLTGLWDHAVVGADFTWTDFSTNTTYTARFCVTRWKKTPYISITSNGPTLPRR